MSGWAGRPEVTVSQGLTRSVSTAQAPDQWIGGWKSQSLIYQRLVESHPLFTYFFLSCLWLFFPSPTHAYVEAPHSLGLICTLSTNIMVLRVEKIDRQNNLIIYRKVRDIKGQHPTDLIKHNIDYDQKRREIILADFEKEFPEWNKKVADLIWELRPPSVMPKLGPRLKDASLPPDQRLQIVDILGGTQDTGGGQAMIQALTPDAPPQVRDRILAKMKENLPGKWRELRRSKELTQAIDGFLDKPETRPLGLALVGVAAKENAIDRVADIARDSKEPEASRTSAIAALGAMSLPSATKTLESLLQIEPADLRPRVVRALGEQLNLYSSDREPAMKALKSLLRASDHELAVRRAAAEALAGTYHGTEWLLDWAVNKKLSPDLQGDVVRLLRNSPFGDLQDRTRVVFAAPRLDPKKLPDIASLVSRSGDPTRGKQILAESQKNDLQCLKCHTIKGVGGNVGPDLSAIGKKASRENLFESILFPSKAIADQYLSWIVETNKGLQITGLLIEETPDHITIRDANAKDTKIAKKDMASREKSAVSIMPADLLAYMTEEDLVDMVAYLFSLKEEK